MRRNECDFFFSLSLSLAQRIHNLTLPHWATQDVQDTLKRVASFEVMYSIFSHKRKEKARLSGGEGFTFEAADLKSCLEKKDDAIGCCD